MEEKNTLKRQIIIMVIGVIFFLAVAVFVYRNVRETIVQNERANLKSLAKGGAQSLESSLAAKKNLIYAVFAGNAENIGSVETGLIRLGERGNYIAIEEIGQLEEEERQACEAARAEPKEVITGPIKWSGAGYYVLLMTKAVGDGGSIRGYVQVEINLDEIYWKEQALSGLELENGRYCIVKDKAGDVVMPGSLSESGIALTHEAGNGCTVEWVYEVKGGTPVRTRKLIAYETVAIGEMELSFYILEDYDKILHPIDRIALYFCLLGAAVLLWTSVLLYKITGQSKKETLLERELLHEKTLNETMKKQEGLMQKYNHSKTLSVLTGSIAHEFNNLMTPIVLYADLLEENEVVQKEMPDETAELKSAAARCEELARQLLEYTRQGKAEKVLTDYDATYAMCEAINMVKKLLPAHVSLKENVCRIPYYIHGQVGALNQILLNLTTNAVHAMKDGGVLSIQFGLSVEDNNSVRLIVEDTGTGIPPEIQRQVFQPFFTTKQAGEGTGIGLTVVRRLVEEHNGRIRVKTQEGKGTMFILDFPRVQRPEKQTDSI